MTENIETVLDDLNKRLSLRAPQKESLERLSKAIEAAGLRKGATHEELDAQREAVRGCFPNEQFSEVEFPPADEFSWKFLSFCFALATGVGKTRLMGAIIAYLYRTRGIRNFVVIAPGKTVYEKLISDFTEGSPKYVFKGLSCFATRKPIIVSGDTYQNAAGILDGRDLLGYSVAINVFNIQKLNERVTGKGKEKDDEELRDVARIRRVNETLGQSYFDYLKGCDDLVVLMDEAHHYRADEAAKTINEMQPVLGIEMTATPRVKERKFDDILFDYGLAKAMRDGFVKEPAVVRRQNFRNDDYVNRPDDLDHQKLLDAMIVHESTKTALTDYAFRKGVPRVKPFVLVVAPDQAYADRIEEYVKSSAFYGGRYADRVIKVYSKGARANNDEAVERLLAIERPENTVEVVIHVNMLSEGWDVTNLYTIVPLRAANSANLVEQTIGRGLRLPYGKRTGVLEIDTLSIVSHDKFDEIIAAARKMEITMRSTEVPTHPRRTITAVPVAVESADGRAEASPVQTAAVQVLSKMAESDTSPHGINLGDENVQSQVEAAVTRTFGEAGTAVPQEEIHDEVVRAIMRVCNAMIDIPIVTISPGNTTMRIADFALDPERLHYALRDDRLVYDYVTNRRVRNVQDRLSREETTPDQINAYIGGLVGALAECNDIDYDANSDLIGRLARDCVMHLAGRLTPSDLANCMRNNLRTLSECLRAQIMAHASYESDEDQVTRVSGVFRLKANTLTVDQDETPRPFNVKIADGEKSRIKSMVFTGFTKCLFSLQKFDSDPERAFSELLEREPTVLKWFKPTLSNLRLFYGPNEYTPDFVFETETEKWLCEVKAVGKVEDAIVQAKKEAALKWCHYASDPLPLDGKRWRYMLIPDVAINSSLELAQAITDYSQLQR